VKVVWSKRSYSGLWQLSIRIQIDRSKFWFEAAVRVIVCCVL
jgi:hypothetical protein